MTLTKLIDTIRLMNETRLPDAMLAEWAAEMDGRILREDYLRREYDIAYDAEDDAQTALLLTRPWDNLYLFHLLEKIHLFRGEYEHARNMAEQWETLHGDWLRNMLSATPRDAFGRPWLVDLAFLRRGSDGVVHLKTMFRAEDLFSVTAQISQNETVKVSYAADSEQIWLHDDYWITVSLTAEDTAAMSAGSAMLVAQVQTVAGERYESDPVQLRVLETNLKEVTEGAG